MFIAKRLLILSSLILLLFSLSACSTRGLNDKYLGATEQRLLTISIDKLMKELPEKDFLALRGKKVYVESHFVEENSITHYAEKRFDAELKERFLLNLTEDTNQADVVLEVFFVALGTDQDSFGFATPEFIIPGAGTTVSIDLISLHMFHGISELYYYAIDQHSGGIKRGERIKATARTDKLALPIISIPINTLE